MNEDMIKEYENNKEIYIEVINFHTALFKFIGHKQLDAETIVRLKDIIDWRFASQHIGHIDICKLPKEISDKINLEDYINGKHNSNTRDDLLFTEEFILSRIEDFKNIHGEAYHITISDFNIILNTFEKNKVTLNKYQFTNLAYLRYDDILDRLSKL